MKRHFFKEESPTEASFSLRSAGIEAEVFSNAADSTHTLFLRWRGNTCISQTWKDTAREKALVAAWETVKAFCASAMAMSEVIGLLEEHCPEAKP